MKPEEAIDYLQDPIGKREKHDEAVQMAIEALEKQIPKKLISKDDYEDCPDCGTILRYWLEEGYCYKCGQKYVWTEE